MDVIGFREFCLSLPFAEEYTPFDETTLVYKVGGRMFAYADMVCFNRFAVKCDPVQAEILRDRYPEVTPAWHSNKRHWNDVRTDGDLPEEFLRRQIRDSYMLVLRRNVTPRTLREEILSYIAGRGLEW